MTLYMRALMHTIAMLVVCSIAVLTFQGGMEARVLGNDEVFSDDRVLTESIGSATIKVTTFGGTTTANSNGVPTSVTPETPSGCLPNSTSCIVHVNSGNSSNFLYTGAKSGSPTTAIVNTASSSTSTSIVCIENNCEEQTTEDNSADTSDEGDNSEDSENGGTSTTFTSSASATSMATGDGNVQMSGASTDGASTEATATSGGNTETTVCNNGRCTTTNNNVSDEDAETEEQGGSGGQPGDDNQEEQSEEADPQGITEQGSVGEDSSRATATATGAASVEDMQRLPVSLAVVPHTLSAITTGALAAITFIFIG